MVPLAKPSNHHVMSLVSRSLNLRDAQREALSQADLQKLQKLKLSRKVLSKKIKPQVLAKKAKLSSKKVWLNPPEIKLMHHNMKHQLLLKRSLTQPVSGN
jgi:hypothetical protein